MPYKDFSVQLKNPDRAPAFTVGKDGKEKPIMMNLQIAECLCSISAADTLDIKEKKQRGDLADRLIDAGEQKFSVEDLALIKEVCAKFFFPHTVRQLLEIIDKEDDKGDSRDH